MTYASVEWVLDQVGSVVSSVANDYQRDTPDGTPDVVVRRVDRDNSRLYDGSGPLDMESPIHERSSELKEGVYIGASRAETAESPTGSEYDLQKETVVGVRLEGLTAVGEEWGHVDPDGAVGVPWDVFERRVKQAIYAGREYPDTEEPNVGFTHLLLSNESNQSSSWADYYRTDFDVVFKGFEDLP